MDYNITKKPQCSLNDNKFWGRRISWRQCHITSGVFWSFDSHTNTLTTSIFNHLHVLTYFPPVNCSSIPSLLGSVFCATTPSTPPPSLSPCHPWLGHDIVITIYKKSYMNTFIEEFHFMVFCSVDTCVHISKKKPVNFRNTNALRFMPSVTTSISLFFVHLSRHLCFCIPVWQHICW